MNRVIQEHRFSSGQSLQIVQGDLTEEQVDAIVNAANARLQHGGGVAGAIVRRGGQQIQVESNAWVREHGPLTHGQPAYTSGGRLPCRYVIHTVGPMWGEGDEDAKLTAAVQSALSLAEQLELTSIAVPAISTGIFGFPVEHAAEVILSAIEDYVESLPDSGLSLIRLTLYDSPTVETFLRIWQEKIEDREK